MGKYVKQSIGCNADPVAKRLCFMIFWIIKINVIPKSKSNQITYPNLL